MDPTGVRSNIKMSQILTTENEQDLLLKMNIGFLNTVYIQTVRCYHNLQYVACSKGLPLFFPVSGYNKLDVSRDIEKFSPVKFMSLFMTHAVCLLSWEINIY